MQEWILRVLMGVGYLILGSELIDMGAFPMTQDLKSCQEHPELILMTPGVWTQWWPQSMSWRCQDCLGRVLKKWSGDLRSLKGVRI